MVLHQIKSKYPWKLTKKVLPQHTDHAGVMWHGSYLSFLEEGRIDALSKVGISYSKLSQSGIEIPVLSLEIKYKKAFIHGDKVDLISQFKLVNQIRLKCKSLFLKTKGDIAAEALIELCAISKKNDSIQIIRKLPEQIKEAFLLLEEGITNKKNPTI